MLVARASHPQDTVVDIGGAAIGGDRFIVIAGPCAVESSEQLSQTGADGILVEVHHRPDAAQSDGDQSLSIEQFGALMTELRPFVTAAGKQL